MGVLAVLAWGCGSEMEDFAADAWCFGTTCGDASEALSDMHSDAVPPDVATSDCTAAYCIDVCTSLGYTSGSCLSTGACSCVTDTTGTESCGDGLDNDGDGEVDEACACASGATQACWTGPPSVRHTGACSDGLQRCTGDMEFLVWGPCEGSVLPSPETCDGLDNDCDGETDEDVCTTTCAFSTEVNCGDGVDNDCDGLVDCNDPECPSCCVPSAEDCRNGVDDDCDGLADCFDADCNGGPEDCTNGIDDNCDGLADCADPACPDCCPSGTCSCCEPGTWRWCDTPTYCSWGRQQCLPSGQWGSCDETSDRPGGCDSYYFEPACCVAAGQCCQNYPYDGTSIGTCEGIASQCP
jgi:hypothetical protein